MKIWVVRLKFMIPMKTSNWSNLLWNCVKISICWFRPLCQLFNLLEAFQLPTIQLRKNLMKWNCTKELQRNQNVIKQCEKEGEKKLKMDTILFFKFEVDMFWTRYTTLFFSFFLFSLFSSLAFCCLQHQVSCFSLEFKWPSFPLQVYFRSVVSSPYVLQFHVLYLLRERGSSNFLSLIETPHYGTELCTG